LQLQNAMEVWEEEIVWHNIQEKMGVQREGKVPWNLKMSMKLRNRHQSGAKSKSGMESTIVAHHCSMLLHKRSTISPHWGHSFLFSHSNFFGTEIEKQILPWSQYFLLYFYQGKHECPLWGEYYTQKTHQSEIFTIYYPTSIEIWVTHFK
jgi:hypothetical protein